MSAQPTEAAAEPVEVAPEAADTKPDASVILAAPSTMEIEGVPCYVARLRARELLLLMQVVAVGLGPAVQNIALDDSEDRVGQMVGLVLMAIPNAGDYTLNFVRQVVVPVNNDRDSRQRVAAAMENPEIDVLLDVVERVILQEREDLEALMGKAQRAFRTVTAAYRGMKLPGTGTSGLSPGRSTSSAGSTDGPTPTS